MKGMMDAEGLPYAKRTHTYNSRLAQELGKWADTQEGGEAIHMPLYQAYFVDQQNIADIELLVSIAEGGWPGRDARPARCWRHAASRTRWMPTGRSRRAMA